MLGGKLKDVAMRCVLRHVLVDASKCVCGWSSAPGPAGGAYSAPSDPVADLGEDNKEGERKGLGRNMER